MQASVIDQNMPHLVIIVYGNEASSKSKAWLNFIFAYWALLSSI